MNPKLKVGISAAAAFTVALALYVAKINKEEAELNCVTPICDESGKPVDCLAHITGSLIRPDGDYWLGCVVFPKDVAVGTQCEPAKCFQAEKPKPRAPK